MRLRVDHPHSQFGPTLARFLYYYSVLVPKVIFTAEEPRGAFTCRSSALAVLADSGPFRGLLLTVLVSRTQLHDLRTPGCVYVSVISTHSFDRFWPVSWTITHRFGVPDRIPRLTNPRVRLRVGHQHSQFWPILARFMGYCSPFWLPERFPRLMSTRVRLRVGQQLSQFWPILARIMDY